VALCGYAAYGGHLEVVKWMQALEGCPWDNLRVCEAAVHGKHLGVLEWLHDIAWTWNVDVCVYAARRGNMEMLKWLLGKGCPCDESACAELCAEAAEHGHMEVRQWLLEEYPC